MDLISSTVLLLMIMDPIGNIPMFNVILGDFPPRKRWRVIVRELLIALAVLMTFLWFGNSILGYLGLKQSSLRIAGGIILFLIALRMVFPGTREPLVELDRDPFIVPLAMPLIAGPSCIAVLLLLASSQPERMGTWFLALSIAWACTATILALSPWILQWVGRRGTRALARLVGMLLVMVAVQLFLDGVAAYMELERERTVSHRRLPNGMMPGASILNRLGADNPIMNGPCVHLPDWRRHGAWGPQIALMGGSAPMADQVCYRRRCVGLLA
jgi:multiple antibiotic resistance protein